MWIVSHITLTPEEGSNSRPFLELSLEDSHTTLEPRNLGTDTETGDGGTLVRGQHDPLDFTRVRHPFREVVPVTVLTVRLVTSDTTHLCQRLSRSVLGTSLTPVLLYVLSTQVSRNPLTHGYRCKTTSTRCTFWGTPGTSDLETETDKKPV